MWPSLCAPLITISPCMDMILPQLFPAQYQKKKKGLNRTGATLAKRLLLQTPVPAWARSEETRPCHMGNSWAIANNSQQSFWLTRKRPTQFQFASGKAALCSLGRLQQSWIAFSNIPCPSQPSSKHYHLIVPAAHKFLPALAQGKYTDFANLAFILIFSPPTVSTLCESSALPSIKELMEERTTPACASRKGKWAGQLPKQIVKDCTEILIFFPRLQ